jgi:hypothetical protein
MPSSCALRGELCADLRKAEAHRCEGLARSHCPMPPVLIDIAAGAG